MRFPLLVSLCGVIGFAGCVHDHGMVSRRTRQDLGRSLTFHASFDKSMDADFALGDPRMQTSPQWGKPRVLTAAVPPAAVHLAPGEGRHGGALRFDRKIQELVGYAAGKNVAYRRDRWGGTFSYWLRLHPEQDLEPGYCDPIQITSKDWNDAAFFTDFSKDEIPRHFRLGVFSDLKHWNPANTKWDDVAESQRPMITVKRPPFSRERWTHVAFTWENFNSGKPDAVARFYLDGVLQGTLEGKSQAFDWEVDVPVIMLGLSLTGWMDDISIFDRPLSSQEITVIKDLPGGVGTLRKP